MQMVPEMVTAAETPTWGQWALGPGSHPLSRTPDDTAQPATCLSVVCLKCVVSTEVAQSSLKKYIEHIQLGRRDSDSQGLAGVSSSRLLAEVLRPGWPSESEKLR